MRKFGIDISRWQRGMDLAQAQAEGVEFVILRGANSCDKDSCFDDFYQQAKALGLGVGCYQYSLATSVSEAVAEAEYLIRNVLNGKQFDYPIYMDCEDDSQVALGVTAMNAIIAAWCSTMEKSGYFAGVYTNGSFYRCNCSGSVLAQKYSWWYAAWCADEITNYPMHQFGGGTNLIRSNIIAGHVCDQDYCYSDFPAIIKSAGLNGYSATEHQTVVSSGEGASDATQQPNENNEEVRTVTLTFNYLQKGDTGPQVLTLQALLNEFNSAGLAVDGGFGSATYQAVLDYQRSRHLAVDGVVGAETWTRLLLK